MFRTALAIVASGLLAPSPAPAAPEPGGQDGPVRAVLFFSPTCPHCHVVMRETLPPLAARYGDRLVVVSVDVTTPEGQALYTATVEEMAIPPSRVGVPTLVVGDRVLVGSGEIPAYLPDLIEDGLAAGGIDWPAVGPLQEALLAGGLTDPGTRDAPGRPGSPAGGATSGAGGGSLVPLTATGVAPAGPWARFRTDPLGNSVAVVVLLVLLAALALGATRFRAAGLPREIPTTPVLPALLVAGLAVAAYLSFVELSGNEAICGPVGDCNTVQQSPWSRLFGVVPVGLVGMAGYLAMGLAWARARRARLAADRRGATRLLWLMAFLGTAFSAWLTFLEPFVIGATCVWCVTSALVMAGVLTVATGLPGSAPAASPRRS